MKSPLPTAPTITVQRMPKRSARRPIATPPNDVPSQAIELASAGAERPPPRSAAIGFNPTAVIHSAPNDSDSSATETLATTQEDRVSMLAVTKPLPGRLMRQTAAPADIFCPARAPGRRIVERSPDGAKRNSARPCAELPSDFAEAPFGLV